MFLSSSLPRLMAIQPDHTGWALDRLTRLAALTTQPPRTLALVDIDDRLRPYEVVDGVAIVPVYGLLVDHLGWIGSTWITGYDGIRLMLSRALTDPQVSAVALLINSPGGYSNGLFELCDWAMEAKAAAGKPVAAICASMAYSAAYAIAVVADSISVPKMGGVGSIGVYRIHMDASRAIDKAGVTPTIVQSGAHKTDGNPLQPLSEAVRADWQATVDDCRTVFAETVAAGRAAAVARRGMTLDVAAVLATEGRCFDGRADTARAVELGLADAVLSPDQAFQALVKFTGN